MTSILILPRQNWRIERRLVTLVLSGWQPLLANYKQHLNV